MVVTRNTNSVGRTKRKIEEVLYLQGVVLARSERFELPTLGFEVRCSIQLSYERVASD